MKKILKFSASWCQPCKMLAKNLETAQLAVPVEEVDIDEKTDMSVEYKIRGVPTLVMLEDGKEVKRVSGVKSVDELNNELVAAKKELFNLRFQNATNQLENTSRIKEVRRNIARIQGAITAKANA